MSRLKRLALGLMAPAITMSLACGVPDYGFEDNPVYENRRNSRRQNNYKYRKNRAQSRTCMRTKKVLKARAKRKAAKKAKRKNRK